MLNSTIKIVAVSLMILSGAFDTLGIWLNYLVFKTQNQQIVEEGGVSRSFFHPYIQVGTLFFGQFIALLIFYIYKAANKQQIQQDKEKAKSQGKQIQVGYQWIALSSLLGCVTNTLQLISLNFLASSVYQLMRGGSIITTFIFSIIILKIKTQKYQIVGSILAFFGVVIVGISALVFSESAKAALNSNFGSASAGTEVLGYVLTIISLFTIGLQFVVQQKIFTKYHIQALRFVGIQGFFGLIFAFIVITIASFIPCSFADNACAIDPSGDLFMESPSSYFHSITNDGFLFAFVILAVFSILTFNTSGALVTIHISALARSVCDVVRTIIIWGVGIIVTVTAGESDSVYKWESLNVNRIILQAVGFSVIIAGNVVYNNLVELKCLQPKNQQESSEALLSSKQKSNQVLLSASND